MEPDEVEIEEGSAEAGPSDAADDSEYECAECSASVGENDLYCHGCGRLLDPSDGACPQCGAVARDGDTYCRRCGWLLPTG
jgi:predicted amidophosphoribosyltransferase